MQFCVEGISSLSLVIQNSSKINYLACQCLPVEYLSRKYCHITFLSLLTALPGWLGKHHPFQ